MRKLLWILVVPVVSLVVLMVGAHIPFWRIDVLVGFMLLLIGGAWRAI